MKSLSEKELYALAKERVEKKRAFKIHFGIYLIFLMITIAILAINGFEFEILIPALGWGIGVIFHFISVYSILNSENAIQKELKKLKK